MKKTIYFLQDLDIFHSDRVMISSVFLRESLSGCQVHVVLGLMGSRAPVCGAHFVALRDCCEKK